MVPNAIPYNGDLSNSVTRMFAIDIERQRNEINHLKTTNTVLGIGLGISIVATALTAAELYLFEQKVEDEKR